jgi:hypothetical protein
MNTKIILFFLCVFFSLNAQNEFSFSSIEMTYDTTAEKWTLKDNEISTYTYTEENVEKSVTSIDYNTNHKISAINTIVKDRFTEQKNQINTSFFYQNDHINRVLMTTYFGDQRDTIQALLNCPSKNTIEITIQKSSNKTSDSLHHFVYIIKNDIGLITEYTNEKLSYDSYSKKPNLSIEHIVTAYENENAVEFAINNEKIYDKSMMHVEQNNSKASYLNHEDIFFNFYKKNILAYLLNAILLKESEGTQSFTYQRFFRIETFLALSKDLPKTYEYKITKYPIFRSIKSSDIKTIINSENERLTINMSYIFNKDGLISTNTINVTSTDVSDEHEIKQTYTYQN